MRADAETTSHSGLISRLAVGGRRVVGQIGVARERIGQIGQRHGRAVGDLLRRAAADEERMAAPLEGHRLARLDRRRSTSIEASASTAARIHLIDERPGGHGRADGANGPGRDIEKIAPRRFGSRRVAKGSPLQIGRSGRQETQARLPRESTARRFAGAKIER